MRNGLITVAALALLAAPALATTVLRFTLADLTQRADVIVRGTCTSVQARLTPRDGVVTDVTLDVIDGLKNAPGPTFSFSTYGGITEERGTFIAGAPMFAVGEQVVLFLDATNRQGYRLAIGMSQGKYTVREDGGRLVASRNLVGLRYVDPRTGDVEEAEAEQGVPLEDLLHGIREHLAGR